MGVAFDDEDLEKELGGFNEDEEYDKILKEMGLAGPKKGKGGNDISDILAEAGVGAAEDDSEGALMR